MPSQLFTDRVDINLRPSCSLTKGVTEVTIGDLHANAIKLMYFLVRQGICTISDEDYSRMVEIYLTEVTLLTDRSIKEFNEIISRIEVVNKSTIVRLIGDELADRGSNDYFVLKLLEKLHDGQVKVEIILSNHSVEFIQAYEFFEERNELIKMMMYDEHVKSLNNLKHLIKNNFVSNQEILGIVNAAYKPSLKLLAYTLDDEKNDITIYSHAGIGLESIAFLAARFGVTYNDDTAKSLACTIDQINQEFTKNVVQNTVHTLYDRKTMSQAYSHRAPLSLEEKNAIEFLIWNRFYDQLNRPKKTNDYRLNFVHGHDSQEQTHDNIFNLDGLLGKSSRHHQEDYLILISGNMDMLILRKGLFSSRVNFQMACLAIGLVSLVVAAGLLIWPIALVFPIMIAIILFEEKTQLICGNYNFSESSHDNTERLPSTDDKPLMTEPPVEVTPINTPAESSSTAQLVGTSRVGTSRDGLFNNPLQKPAPLAAKSSSSVNTPH